MKKISKLLLATTILSAAITNQGWATPIEDNNPANSYEFSQDQNDEKNKKFSKYEEESKKIFLQVLEPYLKQWEPISPTLARISANEIENVDSLKTKSTIIKQEFEQKLPNIFKVFEDSKTKTENPIKEIENKIDEEYQKNFEDSSWEIKEKLYDEKRELYRTYFSRFLESFGPQFDSIPRTEWELLDSCASNSIKELAPLVELSDQMVPIFLEFSEKEDRMDNFKRDLKIILKELKNTLESAKSVVKINPLPKTTSIYIAYSKNTFNLFRKFAPNEMAELDKYLHTATINNYTSGSQTIAQVRAEAATLEATASSTSKDAGEAKTESQLANIVADVMEEQDETKAAFLIPSTIHSFSNVISSILSSRLINIGGISSGSESMKFGPWAKVFMGYGEQQVNERVSSAYTTNSFGATLGCDVEIDGYNSIFGAAISAARTNAESGESPSIKKTSLTSGILSGYGNYDITENLNVSGQIGAGMSFAKMDFGTEKTGLIGLGNLDLNYTKKFSWFDMPIKIVGVNLSGGSYSNSGDSKSSSIDSKLDFHRISLGTGLGIAKTIQTEAFNITPEIHFGGDYRISGSKNLDISSNLMNIFDSISGDLDEKNKDLIKHALAIVHQTTLFAGFSIDVAKSESFSVSFGADAQGTLRHIAASLASKVIPDDKGSAATKKLAENMGDFYSVNGYLKLKISL